MFRRVNIRKWALCCLIVLLQCSITAQKTTVKKRPTPAAPSKETIQNEAKQVEAQIRYNQKLLQETQENQKSSLNRLDILNDQIKQRDRLIHTVQSEIQSVDTDIKDQERGIVELEGEVSQLIDEYTRMIIATNKHLNVQNQMLFVLASEDFNQAYLRIKYFQQYSAHRKKQIELIGQKRDELTQIKSNLESVKKSKIQLLSREEQEKRSLDAEKITKNKELTSLQKNEKELISRINKDQARAARLNQEIEKIIANEIKRAKEAVTRKAREEAAKTVANKPSSSSKVEPLIITLTPEETKLSNDFVANRGKLPWPVERGVITGQFGTHEHPDFKNVKISNLGIDITTERTTPCRAVFSGEVVVSMGDPTDPRVRLLIIKHGSYRTVYTNLASVTVKVGDKVTTKQNVGTIFTDAGEGRTVLRFQIWKDMEKLNPELWLARYQ